jgi:undecaprenyl-diphosphatase
VEFLRAFDDGIHSWLQGFWGSRLDAVMLDVTALGGTAVLALVVLFSSGLLLVLGRRRTAVFILLVCLGGELLVAGVKAAVGRDRPKDRNRLVVRQPTSGSFPSGHSASSAVIYLTLALVASTPLTGRRGRRYLMACAAALVFLIGVSRVYLGVHYPTDVLGGWAIGVLWALGCRYVEDHWQPLRREEAPG